MRGLSIRVHGRVQNSNLCRIPEVGESRLDVQAGKWGRRDSRCRLLQCAPAHKVRSMRASVKVHFKFNVGRCRTSSCVYRHVFATASPKPSAPYSDLVLILVTALKISWAVYSLST